MWLCVTVIPALETMKVTGGTWCHSHGGSGPVELDLRAHHRDR